MAAVLLLDRKIDTRFPSPPSVTRFGVPEGEELGELSGDDARWILTEDEFGEDFEG